MIDSSTIQESQAINQTANQHTNQILEVVQELITHLNTIKQDLDSIKQDLENRTQEITPNLLILLIRQNQEIMMKLEGQQAKVIKEPIIRSEKETQTQIDQCNVGVQAKIDNDRDLMPPPKLEKSPINPSSDMPARPPSPSVIPEDYVPVRQIPIDKLGSIDKPIEVESLFSERKSRPPPIKKNSPMKPSYSQVKVKKEMVSMKSLRAEADLMMAGRSTRSNKRVKKSV